MSEAAASQLCCEKLGLVQLGLQAHLGAVVIEEMSECLGPNAPASLIRFDVLPDLSREGMFVWQPISAAL